MSGQENSETRREGEDKTYMKEEEAGDYSSAVDCKEGWHSLRPWCLWSKIRHF